MSEPDETMVEAVAVAIHMAECGEPETCSMPTSRYEDQARAALSVPVVRDALARDAQVREIVARGAVGGWGPLAVTACLSDLGDIAALCPSPGDRDNSEEQR